MNLHPSEVTAREQAHQAADSLRRVTGIDSFDIAVVLGSGWVPAVDRIGTTVAELSVTDLPYFSPPAVEGHAGKVRAVDADGTRVLVFLGRTHLYE